MSDFDAVLERLLTDPSFASALAADPDVALAGYRLDDGETALLRSQVAGDTAADVAKVETRTNKSSTFGLLAPFAALGGVVDSFGHSLAEPGHAAGAGSAPGGAGAHTGFGSAPGGAGGAGPGVRSAFGDAPVARTGLGAPAHDALGAAPRQGFGGPPQGHAQRVEL